MVKRSKSLPPSQLTGMTGETKVTVLPHRVTSSTKEQILANSKQLPPRQLSGMTRETRVNVRQHRVGAFHAFIRFALVWFCLFLLPLGVWEGLRFVIVALPGLFSYFFLLSICQ